MSLSPRRYIPPPKNPPVYRIALRDDDDGELDDVFVRNVSMFRLERMSNKTFWACCYFDDDDDQRLDFWFSVQKGHLFVSATDTPHGPEFTYEPERES